MFFHFQSKLLVLVLLFSSVSCECQDSYMTICDSVEDVDFGKIEDVTELVIGSKDFVRQDLTSFNLFDLKKLEKLKIFILLGQIDHLDSRISNATLPNNFDFISLCGNELRQIHKTHVPNFSARKLSLVNNKIELIEKKAIKNHKVEIIDLSDNLLEAIEREILPSTDSTKTVIIRRNKISYIEVLSFGDGLRVLNLDWNRLKFIQRNVLDNLKNLEELTLSHNSLTIVPYMGNLVRLEVINMAFNGMVSIERHAFASATRLQILDLSYNKISDPNVIHDIFVEGEQTFLKVNLAFNRLKHLNVRNSIYLVSRTFVLFGNPWDCAKLEPMSKVLLCHVTKCDLEFYSSGKTPYCINYGSAKQNSIEERIIEKFQAVIKNNSHLVDCVLGDGLRKMSCANLNIALCDDSDEESFRLSLLQDRLTGSILD